MLYNVPSMFRTFFEELARFFVTFEYDIHLLKSWQEKYGNMFEFFNFLGYPKALVERNIQESHETRKYVIFLWMNGQWIIQC